MHKLFAALLSAAVALPACGSESPPAGEGAHSAPMLSPGPGAFASDFATSSDFFTRMSRLEKGLPSSPHNLVRIFYSRNIESVIAEPAFDVPVGTVAIKQQDRDADGAIDNVLTMIKQPAGFDPDNGDWLYEQRAPDGTLENAGKTAFCIGCHRGFTATDHLAGGMLRDP